MKVLITGGDGQVGHALGVTGPAAWEITALSRSELDITDQTGVRGELEKHAPDAVINAAAYTAVDLAESEPGAAIRINSAAVAALAEACHAHGALLVHFSTDFVFDGTQSQPYRPDDKTNPISVYGMTKREGELAALEWPSNLVIRTSWVYGTHGENFVRTMLRLMTERDEVRVVADQIGTPTHALSLARASWSLIEAAATGIHHFSDAGVASWFDFAAAIQEEALALGILDRAVRILPITTAEFPSAARRPAYAVLDKTLTWQALGAPARHWRVELREMLLALRNAVND